MNTTRLKLSQFFFLKIGDNLHQIKVGGIIIIPVQLKWYYGICDTLLRLDNWIFWCCSCYIGLIWGGGVMACVVGAGGAGNTSCSLWGVLLITLLISFNICIFFLCSLYDISAMIVQTCGQ